MEQRERWVKEGYFFVPQRKQFILLGTDIQRIAQRQLVFLGDRRRRIQFIVGRLKRTGDFSAELFQHGTGTVSMVGVFFDNLLHYLSHKGKCKHRIFEVIKGSLTRRKGTPSQRCVILVDFLFFIANLFPKIIVVIDDGSEFIHHFTTLPPKFPVPKILRIGLFFLGREIAISSNQLTDSLFHHRPLHDKLCVFLFIPGREAVKADTLCVMILPNAAARDSVAITTGAIFLFQKRNIGFFGFVLLELFKDSQFSLRKTASTHQYIVDSCLRNIKAGAVLGVSMINSLLLFLHRGQRLFTGIEPSIQEKHAFHTQCNGPPLHIHFSLTA